MSDRLLKESDVLKAIDKRIKELSKHPEFVRKNGHIDVIGVKKYILAIPSADRPQGEWINKGAVCQCTRCKGYSRGLLEEKNGKLWKPHDLRQVVRLEEQL